MTDKKSFYKNKDKEEKKVQQMSSFIQWLICTYPKKLWLANFEQNENSISDATDIYNEEKYSSMSTDINRNRVYNKGIKFAVDSFHIDRVIQILEIGPGADACLTKMILNCNKNLFVHAIESNPYTQSTHRSKHVSSRQI